MSSVSRRRCRSPRRRLHVSAKTTPPSFIAKYRLTWTINMLSGPMRYCSCRSACRGQVQPSKATTTQHHIERVVTPHVDGAMSPSPPLCRCYHLLLSPPHREMRRRGKTKRSRAHATIHRLNSLVHDHSHLDYFRRHSTTTAPSTIARSTHQHPAPHIKHSFVIYATPPQKRPR